MSKSFQLWDHLFPLLLPKDSKYLKSLGIGLREVGAKRPLNGVRKCDRQTDTHTDISTYRKNQPRGPILWKKTQPKLSSPPHFRIQGAGGTLSVTDRGRKEDRNRTEILVCNIGFQVEHNIQISVIWIEVPNIPENFDQRREILKRFGRWIGFLRPGKNLAPFQKEIADVWCLLLPYSLILPDKCSEVDWMVVSWIVSQTDCRC